MRNGVVYEVHQTGTQFCVLNTCEDTYTFFWTLKVAREWVDNQGAVKQPLYVEPVVGSYNPINEMNPDFQDWAWQQTNHATINLSPYVEGGLPDLRDMDRLLMGC